MLRFISIWISFSIVTGLLVGCSDDGSSHLKFTTSSASIDSSIVPSTAQTNENIITFVPKSLDNPVFLEAKEEAERTSRKYAIRLEWLAPMNTQEQEQEQIIESLIRRKVGGIIVSCIDPERLSPYIDKAIEAGIKVATFDSDCPNSKRLFYVGTNNYDIGYASGLEMRKLIKAKNLPKSQLEALVMTGSGDSLNLNERLLGFTDALAGEVQLHIRATLTCNDDLALAGELLESYMKSNSDIDIFYSTGGWPLLVPSDSMPNYRKWRENGGAAVVIDTFYPMIVAAENGLADSLIGQDFAMMGRRSLELMTESLIEGKVRYGKYFTDIEFADRSNFTELLQKKEPWEIK